MHHSPFIYLYIMKNLFFAILVMAAFACNETETGKVEETAATTKNDSSTMKSIPTEKTKRVGNTDIKINYTAPAVRGRTIWGALVPYGKVWVSGAHNATTLEIGKAFKVGDKHIPAGKYGFFTVPGKDEWVVIINKNWEQHLADEYSAAEDVQRINVKPIQNESVTERLEYVIDQTGERTATIILNWEKLSIQIPIEIID